MPYHPPTLSGKRKSLEDHAGHHRDQKWKRCVSSHPYSIGHKPITWPHINAEKVGNYVAGNIQKKKATVWVAT